MPTTIQIGKDTSAILKQLKEEFQVGSVNEVILKLLSERGDGNQHPIIDDEPEAMDEDIEIVKNAKIYSTVEHK